MISAITASDQAQYPDEFDAMFRHRKQIFVDFLKWDIPVVDGVYEKDQFDTAEAVYLIAREPGEGRHLGSVRLLASTGPHLLATLFPFLCDGDPPIGPDTWEITRLCTAPGLPRAMQTEVRNQLATALVEYGLLHGIRHYTSMAHAAWLSQVLATGWTCEPLGPLHDINGEMVGALKITIDAATLQMFRERWGLTGPVLDLTAHPAPPAKASADAEADAGRAYPDLDDARFRPQPPACAPSQTVAV